MRESSTKFNFSLDNMIEWCTKQCDIYRRRRMPVTILALNVLNNNPQKSDRFVEISAKNTCNGTCVLTRDRSKAESADAIIYFTRATYIDDLPKYQKKTHHVFLIDESASYYDTYWEKSRSVANVPSDYFTIMMTYKNDSDVGFLYGWFTPISGETKHTDKYTRHEVNAYTLSKKLPILTLNSHCDTKSKRELYIHKLEKFINITKYGQCYDHPCDWECEENEIKRHYFILAFENSVCLDCVTEKFWRLKKLIVPIVLSRSVYQNFVPDDAGKVLIAADDFESPRKLADYLNYLMLNRTAYLE